MQVDTLTSSYSVDKFMLLYYYCIQWMLEIYDAQGYAKWFLLGAVATYKVGCPELACSCCMLCQSIKD